MPRKKAVKLDKSMQEWHPPTKGAFLEALRTVRFVSQTCDIAKIPRSTVYMWREHDTAFVAAMEDTEQRYVDDIREEVRRRAMGNGGSDELLKMMARAKAPEFQDKAASTVNVTFVQLVVGRLQGIVQRFFPISCPHCGKHLEGRKQMAQELARLDAIELTATAVTPE